MTHFLTRKLKSFVTTFFIWVFVFLLPPAVVVGCGEDQPPEAPQSQGLHEPTGWGLQTRREPHHQHPAEDPADGHLRYDLCSRHTHTVSLTHTHTHTHTHPHTHTASHTLTFTHPHTHTQTPPIPTHTHTRFH